VASDSLAPGLSRLLCLFGDYSDLVVVVVVVEEEDEEAAVVVCQRLLSHFKIHTREYMFPNFVLYKFNDNNTAHRRALSSPPFSLHVRLPPLFPCLLSCCRISLEHRRSS
jgi:hypothetical protein